MNKEILKSYINEYKLNFEFVNQEEIYKWKAVKCFQDNWNIESEDFYEMLNKSLAKTKNLLDSGQYFPLRMLIQYAKRKPQEVKKLFEFLYDEEEDLFERIIFFQTEIKKIHDGLFDDKNSYQDDRAVIVYLVLNYPERYFFYKFRMFKQFAEKMQLGFKPIMGRIENISHFNSICEIIKFELASDQELLKLHKNRISEDCYYDENFNILTQDFIYAVAKNLNSEKTIKPSNEITEIFESKLQSNQLQIIQDKVNFTGRIINFVQNNIENKRIGDLGELWVLKYEIQKLKNANKHNLIKKIKHISKDEGDGTGYDIQSFDINGNKIYIEVKTTKGNKNSTFYISRNELERSKLEKENYYLYRVYDYNENNEAANLLKIRGDLTNICEVPLSYKINLKNE